MTSQNQLSKIRKCKGFLPVGYTPWTTGEWAAFNPPQVAGYAVTPSTVAKVAVTDQTKDTTVEVNYRAGAQAAHVKYVDDDNKQAVVKTTDLQGKTGDLVTNQVTYGKWSTGEWPAFTPTTINGYTPSQTTVSKTPVTEATQNQTITITYQAGQHSMHINYIDNGDGKTVVHQQGLAGNTGDNEPAQPTPEPAQPTSENDVPATPVPAKNSEVATGVTTQPAPLSAANVATGDATPAGQAQLPQTGDAGDTASILAGLAIAGSQLALLGIRKKAGQH